MKKWLRSNEKAVYRITGAAILTGAVLLCGEGFLGIGGLDSLHLAAAAAALVLAAGLNYMGMRGRILCLAAVLLSAVIHAAAAGTEKSAAFLNSFFPWLAGGESPEEWRRAYGLLQTGMLTGMCYLLQILFEKVPALKRAFAALTFLVMAVFLFLGRKVNHYGVAFLLCFLVIVRTEGIQGSWKKVRSSQNSREAHTLWIMPFLAVYLALLAVMPAPEEPYDWRWAKNIYRRIEETVLTYTRNIKWGKQEGFGMSFTGFSGEGDLKGDLAESSEHVMTVKLSGKPSENAFGGPAGAVYLTGRIYDIFDGRGWRQEQPGYEGEVFLDTAETLYAVRRYNGKYGRDYLKEISLEIRYENFNTGRVFAPLKTWGLTEKDSEEVNYFCEGGSLRWQGQRGYGTEYELRYFGMNTGVQEFDRFLEEITESGERTSEGGERLRGRDGEMPEVYGELWEEVQRESGRQNGESFSPEDLARYREGIYEGYLGEVSLSLEVRNYLEKITENAGTNVEKLRAIERELASFSYTLTPGELPDRVRDEEGFLDYFLLESRQGYCTYFATAFVLLARAEGIPARYVQGYCVPGGGHGEIAVDSSMAHAWPEVYLKGAGWIPFEPVPGYGEGRHASWDTIQPKEEDTDGEEESGGNAQAGPAKEDPEASGNRREDEEAPEDLQTKPEGDTFSWRLLGIALPVILAVCGAALGADHVLRKYRYGKMKPEEKFRREVFGNLEILAWLGLERKEWETLEELRERAQLPECLHLHFIEDYERILYGGKILKGDGEGNDMENKAENEIEEMLEGALREKEALLGLLKEEKKWTYLCCRMGLFFKKP